MIYLLDSNLAQQFGILEAILLSQFRYWVDRNEANERNFYDDNWWTYNSMQAFTKLFPFASEKSLRNALKHLEDEGLIVTGNYNKLHYDRTKWYALTQKGRFHTDIFADSIRQKGQMETAKRANGIAQKGEPIPSKYQINNQDNNISSSLRSEDIYSDEPKKADKKKPKLKMKDVYKDLPEELADTLKDFEDMRKAIKKVATPNAMKLILKDLDKLAGDNTEKKIAILEQSIKNSWQGVFPLKEETNNGIKETNGHDHRGNKSDTRFDSGRDRDTPPEGFKF